MRLYVIRHAIAVDAAGAGDDARELTEEGRERFAEGVRGLERAGVRFDRLLHSPLVRAVQTAELAARLVEGETEVSPHLTSAPTPELLAALAGESVAVVGHEPWLSELVAWLISGERALGHAFPLKKGGVAVLEGNPRPGDMVLIGFYSPAFLRELGRER
jgi:phosphohistidine phosphatase